MNMTFFQLIFRNIFHYIKNNLLLASGIAITTMIITGPLITGDSLKFSLEKAVNLRLGNISQVISARDRLFTTDPAKKIGRETGVVTSSALKTSGIAVFEGGKSRISHIQVTGIDKNFSALAGSALYDSLGPGEAIISSNLAKRLNVKKNDFFLLRIKKEGIVPLNTPFVSDEKQSVSCRVRVKEIADRNNLGQFNLQASQIPPFNVFIDLDWLNQLLGPRGKANCIFLAATDKNVAEILSRNIEPEDVNIQIRLNPLTNEWIISSGRVFIDSMSSEKLVRVLPSSTPVLTYFVNQIRSAAGRVTPYSFVAALGNGIQNDDEIIINSWLAEDLAVQKGDTLQLSYFTIGPFKELTENKKSFVVDEITDMQGVFADSTLMPVIPGLSDAGNCRDWDTDVPVDLEKIRDKDEDYWKRYRGTPKAFISLKTGESVWSNRFGNLTSIRVRSDGYDYQTLIEIVKKEINPFENGFEIQNVKKDGLNAARNGTDFTGLFFGLSFFILVAGIILCSLLFVFNIETRSAQIHTFFAIGYTSQMIERIFLSEGIVISFFGSAAGLVLAVFYHLFVFSALNNVWNDIVRMDMLESLILPGTLLTGFAISMIVAFLTIRIALRRHLSKLHASYKTVSAEQKQSSVLWKITGITLFGGAVMIVIFQFCNHQDLKPILFFISGSLLLTSFLIGSFRLLHRIETGANHRMSFFRLILKNLVRNKTRSITILFTLAVSTFVIISTGTFRQGDSNDDSGTGGFMYIAESTVPVLKRLNDPAVQKEFGLTNRNVVQMKVHEGDDASCLNLNRTNHPRVLGVKPDDLSGRFSFPSLPEGEQNGWALLNEKNGNTIPAVADLSVIKWGLGKKIGDTLTYTNEKGEPVNMKLIAGLTNSIFQGNLIISEKNFIENFPSSSGSNVFLIGAGKDTTGITEEFNLAFRDYGWEMKTTGEKLAAFNSVQNTYLEIFLILGYIGLFIGTLGLIVILARNIRERRNEIAILSATGYKRTAIFGLLVAEFAFLLVVGIVTGMSASLISILPQLISGSGNGPVIFFFSVFILIFGLIWIIILTHHQVKRIKISSHLRND